MTAFNSDKMPPEVANAMAKMMAKLVVLGEEDPLAAERVATLVDSAPRMELLIAAVLEVLPAEINEGVWTDWIEGGTFSNGATRLANPDKDQQKSARGAWKSAVDNRDRLAREVATCRQKLADAEELLQQSEHAVKTADAQLRAIVCYRFVIDAAKLFNTLFAMGPLFTVCRAISVYQRRDTAFEEALDETGRAWLDEHLANRNDTSRRIVELLDLFAGDAQIEMRLHNAIHKVLTKAMAAVESEKEEAGRTGARLSATAKRTIRNYEQRRTSVRREGLRNDYREVLAGLKPRDVSATDNAESEDT